MITRALGQTGLRVSRLGLGCAEIGFELTLDQTQTAAELLHAALDAGITYLDTAPCYGISEELMGRAVADHRDEFVLGTKAGHVTGGYAGEPWTARTVGDSIERSLHRLRTDRLDLLQLHSCDTDILEKGEVIEVLQRARDAGKVRFLGYSGDGDAARWAVDSGIFDTLQTSCNLVDQRARHGLLAAARERGMGIICKRPVANDAWRLPAEPSAYVADYVRRARAMQEIGPIAEAPDDPILLSLGFAFAQEEIDTLIVGTKSLDHLRQNLARVRDDLPLAKTVVAELRRRFDVLAVGPGWDQRE